MSNVRERQSEIGILRAIGLKASKILSLFLLKAVVMGFVGAILGIFVGLVISPLSGKVAFSEAYLNWQIILLAVALAPLISLLASWIPAFLASQQDPAVILSQE